jgi:hypothetical protein
MSGGHTEERRSEAVELLVSNRYQGGDDNEANQKSTATFQKRSGKQDDGRGHRQGRGADGTWEQCLVLIRM